MYQPKNQKNSKQHFPQRENKQDKDNNKVEIRTPRIDLFEMPDQYYLRLSLPGVKKDSLEIFFNKKGDLEIKGKVETVIPAKIKHIVVQEIFQGPFHREIEIPGKYDKQSLSFGYDRGILEVFFNKLS